MDCKLELQNITAEDKSVSILYATHDFIVYQKSNKLILDSCDNIEMSSIVIPIDYLSYKCLDINDALIFVFSNTEILILDKTGMVPIRYKINSVTLGHIVTDIYQFSNQNNQIIFGTKQLNRIQFVNYDFIEQKRIIQSSSWNASLVTNMILVDTILYAVLDKIILVAIDMSTGELLWKKFETAEIMPGLVIYDKYLLYSCQGMLKQTDGNEIKSIKIPDISISSILHANGRETYMTSNKNKNVICYKMILNKLKWEFLGKDFIHENVIIKSSKNTDVLAARTDNYVALIDLSTGKSEYNIKTNKMARIRHTGDHLLIQKYTGFSTLVPGINTNQLPRG